MPELASALFGKTGKAGQSRPDRQMAKAAFNKRSKSSKKGGPWQKKHSS
jgi:hypothetical protein